MRLERRQQAWLANTGLRGDDLQLEGQVRRHGSLRSQAAEALEEDNAKLKKLLAEQMLDAAALRELLSKNVWFTPSV